MISTISSSNKSVCVLVYSLQVHYYIFISIYSYIYRYIFIYIAIYSGRPPHGGCIELCLLNVKILPLMLLGTGTPDHTHVTNHNVVDW